MAAADEEGNGGGGPVRRRVRGGYRQCVRRRRRKAQVTRRGDPRGWRLGAVCAAARAHGVERGFPGEGEKEIMRGRERGGEGERVRDKPTADEHVPRGSDSERENAGGVRFDPRERTRAQSRRESAQARVRFGVYSFIIRVTRQQSKNC